MTDLPDFDAAAERRGNLRTIRRVAPYLWPDGQDWAKRRVVTAMAALILAKLVTVATPFAYGAAVDALVPEDGAEPAVWLGLGAIGLTVAYGLARLMSVGFSSCATRLRPGRPAGAAAAGAGDLQHIHALSLRYHITRKTGGLSRIIERGVKGVEFLLRFLLFSIGPLILELSLVAIVFAVVSISLPRSWW
jgi:ABC-type multidrug transport system fused ATPase/permease subunit